MSSAKHEVPPPSPTRSPTRQPRPAQRARILPTPTDKPKSKLKITGKHLIAGFNHIVNGIPALQMIGVPSSHFIGHHSEVEEKI